MKTYLTSPYWCDLEVKILEIEQICPSLTVAKVQVLDEGKLVHESGKIQVVNILDLVEK